MYQQYELLRLFNAFLVQTCCADKPIPVHFTAMETTAPTLPANPDFGPVPPGAYRLGNLVIQPSAGYRRRILEVVGALVAEAGTVHYLAVREKLRRRYGVRVSRPAVSRYLRVLRDAGYVRVTGRGEYAWCRPDFMA